MCEERKRANRVPLPAAGLLRKMLLLGVLMLSSTLQGWGRAPVSPHVKVAHRVQGLILDAMLEAGFTCTGTGGSMMNEVHKLYLCLDIVGYASVEDLREIIVAARAVCLETGEADDEIQQYLDQAPFSERHLNLQFVFSSVDSIWAPKGYVSSAVTGAKGITYHVGLDEKTPSRVLHKESLEEAKRRVKGLSLEEAMEALPRTPEQAAPPFWSDETFYSISISSEESRVRPFSNPMFAEKKED